MRKTILKALLAACWVAIAGCSESSTTLHTDRPSADASSETKTLGMLEYRRQTVHLLPGGRYTVKDADGDVLAADLDDWEMSERFPFLYQRVQEGLADGTLHAGGPDKGFSIGIDNQPTTTYKQGRIIEKQYSTDAPYRSPDDQP